MTRDSFIAHDNATRHMPLVLHSFYDALGQTVDPFSAGQLLPVYHRDRGTSKHILIM